MNLSFNRSSLLKVAASCSLLLYGCAAGPEPSPVETESGVTGEIVEEVNTNALQHFMDGEMYLSQGNFPMAVLEFQDALRYDPGSSSIHTSLAEVYVRLGKLERARESLEEALELDAFNKDARELLAQQFLMQKNIESALQQYQILEENHPDELQYAYVISEILVRKGDLESAQDKLWSVYQRYPSELQALMRAAEIARQRGELDFAWEAYSMLAKEQPDNIQFWRSYSELAVMLQKFDQAMNGLNRLAQLTSDDPAVRERLAILYLDNGEMEQADSLLSILYDEGTRTPGILYYLGRIAISRNNYSQLAVLAAEQVDLFPDEVSGHTNLALAHINLENTVDAIAVLLKARAKFPESFGVNYLLGSTYSMEKEYHLAKRSLKTALSIDPDSRPTKHLLATVHNYLEEWDSSDELYLELLSTNQNDGQALNNYGYTLAERGIKLKTALEMAERAVELDPENPAYLDTIGWIYFKLDEFHKALDYIEKSIARNPENAVVLEHLGDVLMKVNRQDDARAHYQKAFSLDQDNERLREKAKE